MRNKTKNQCYFCLSMRNGGIGLQKMDYPASFSWFQNANTSLLNTPEELGEPA